MNKPLENIVVDWVPDNAKVIDFGCGDGSLLKALADKKSITGYGVENDPLKIQDCIESGISVIQQDIDEGIQGYKNMGFDMAIMASSIQCLRRPKDALQNILEVASQCVITLPNFGNWELRTGLLKGKMPSSSQLPHSAASRQCQHSAQLESPQPSHPHPQSYCNRLSPSPHVNRLPLP